MIKPINKPKKKRNQTIGFWARKADKKIQELGRQMHEKKGCLICPNPYSCLHHFYPKSQSTHLRYNWRNLIPVCVGCHLKHHSGDPEIHIKVIEVLGEAWLEDLTAERNANRYITGGYSYYRSIYENLEKITPYKVS